MLVVLLAGAVVAPVAFYALFTRPTGFGLQGRQLLPALVLVPLLAGEMVYRSATVNAPRARVGVLQRSVPMLVAIVQIGAWWVNARRFAVGDHGPFWFFAHPAWSPPAGWTPWLTAVILAVACLSIVALSARRSGSSGPPVSRRLA